MRLFRMMVYIWRNSSLIGFAGCAASDIVPSIHTRVCFMKRPPPYNDRVRRRFVPMALVLAAGSLWAQLDERRVTSPNGQIEFRLFIAPPPDSASLDGIAYQVWYRGKILIETSYLGFDIFSQAPLLGEKV